MDGDPLIPFLAAFAFPRQSKTALLDDSMSIFMHFGDFFFMILPIIRIYNLHEMVDLYFIWDFYLCMS